MVESTPAAEFDEQFGALLHGTLEMFNDVVKDEGMVESDIDKVYRAEEQVKLLWKRSKETVDQARDDLRAISREYHQHELSSRRSANIPSAEEHDAQMAAERAFIVSRLKSNRGLEQSVTQLQAELEELQRERKEEEADAVEVSELNSEVLRVKMYRDMGFTPVEENGIFTKVLVRSQKTQDARTVQLDSSNNDYFWATFLWDTVSA